MLVAGIPAKKSTKAKTAADHPPYGKMVEHAVKELEERDGSSRQAIAKYIKTHYKVDDKAEQHIRRALVSGVKSGKLVHTKGIGASGSFKLSEKATKLKVVKPKVAKKTTTPKKKLAAKKPGTAGIPVKRHAAEKPETTKPKTVKPKNVKTPEELKVSDVLRA